MAFGFKNPGFYGLKDVDAAEVTLNDEYFEVMPVCNSENPTVRSEDPLCDYHKVFEGHHRAELDRPFSCVGSFSLGDLEDGL